MENAAIYSHKTTRNLVVGILEKEFGAGNVLMKGSRESWQRIDVVTGTGGLQLNCRQRSVPGHELREISEPITQNLAGMYNFVSGFAVKNRDIRDRFLYKVASINMEIGTVIDPHIDEQVKNALLEIASTLDGFIFSNCNSGFCTKDEVPGFWDGQGRLILDAEGNTELSAYEVSIETAYYKK